MYKYKFNKFNEVGDVAFDMLKGKYPNFVYRNKSNSHEVPCFCFHEAVQEELEPMFEFLRLNGYKTLSLAEFEDIVLGKAANPGKCVYLTFDDGLRSIWETLFPLLEKYDFRATSFIIPGRINYRSQYLPNLKDVWENRAKAEDLQNGEAGQEPLCTWEEIQVMSNSGLIDFDSHSLDHSLVFTDPDIVDFISPAALADYHAFEFPRYRVSTDDVTEVTQLGAPLYRTSPRMSGVPRYKDSETLRQACTDFVAGQGGESFFQQENWRDELRDFAAASGHYKPESAEFESDAQCAERVRFEIAEAKRLIEEHLEGKTSKHLCYPWGAGSDLSCRISKDLGYVMSYWSHPQDNKRKIVVNQNPYVLDRLGPDFFFLLPGQGRRTLAEILLRKARRRLTAGSPFLTH